IGRDLAGMTQCLEPEPREIERAPDGEERESNRHLRRQSPEAERGEHVPAHVTELDAEHGNGGGPAAAPYRLAEDEQHRRARDDARQAGNQHEGGELFRYDQWSTTTSVVTLLAMKQASCARWWRSAIAASSGALPPHVTVGWSVTRVIAVLPSARFSRMPSASST